ncbi:MAG: trypsin-like peptidase domain-containing protein [Candidatus Nitrosocaldaceae archaeon]
MKRVVSIVLIAIAVIAVFYYLKPVDIYQNKPIEEPQQPIEVPIEKPKTPIIQDKHLNGESEILTLPQLFDKVKDSVVKISVRVGINEGVGSGFVYTSDGYIITNNHVVEGADKITVTFPNGISYTARIIGRDAYTDLAVIKVNTKEELKPLILGDSSTLSVGEEVAAIGNPFGLSSSMTSGIVSQLGRLLDVPNAGGFVIPDVIQTDAAINPGNSGGPLLDMYGRVVGVNTAIISRTGEFSGIGFAVPSNTVKKVVPALINEGRYRHPWLGVSGSDLTPELASYMNIEARGFLVMDVIDNSPAAKAGIKKGDREVSIDGRVYLIGGDVIIGVDEVMVRSISDILIYLQREKVVGDEITIKIIRDGKMINLETVLEERPNISESP